MIGWLEHHLELSLLVCMRFWSQPGPRYVAESLIFINLGAYQALILLRFYSLLVESPGRLLLMRFVL